MLGRSDFLDYMGDFRYPLLGEFATFASIANEMRFPSDWGIEVGILAEMYRIVRTHGFARWKLPRATITSTSRSAPTWRGACCAWWRTSPARSTPSWPPAVRLSRDFLVTLKHTYMTNARAYVRVYEAVAEMNKVSDWIPTRN